MKSILIAVAMLCCSLARAGTVECFGSNDTAAIQAALNAGGVVRLRGSAHCAVAATLVLTVQGTSLLSEVDIVSTANPAIHLQGFRLSVRGEGRRISIWGPGVGVYALSGGMFTLKELSINTSGNGIWIGSGAGLTIADVNMNGQQWMNTHALKVDGPWDSISIRDVLSEEHDHGLRFGGGVFNVDINGVKLDRLRSSYGNGLWIEAPTNSGNFQVVNLWMSMGYCYVAMTAFSGALIHTVQMANIYVSGFAQNQPCTSGTITDFQAVNFKTAP